MADDDLILRFEGVSGFKVSAAGRGGGPGVAMQPPALQAAGLTAVGEPVAFQLEPPRRLRGSDWAGRSGRVVLDVPRSDDAYGELVIARNDSGYRIVPRDQELSDSERSRFTVPVAPGPGATRGVIGLGVNWVLQKVVFPRVDAVLGKVGEGFVQRWEAQRRPHQMRLYTASGYLTPSADVIEPGDLRPGLVLLLVHGTNSLSHARSGLGALPEQTVARLSEAYKGQVIAFDHPTLGTSPIDNAAWLADWLNDIDGDVEIDVLCHSRGGLVTRLLIERPDLIGQDRRREPSPPLPIRTATFVGTPNRGTPLADTKFLSAFGDRLLSLAAVIPDNPVTTTLEGVVTVAKQLAFGLVGGLEGLVCMAPGSKLMLDLEKAWAAGTPPVDSSVRYRAVVGDFEPAPGSGWWHSLKDGGVDVVFAGEPNDVIVPTVSGFDLGAGPGIGFHEIVVFDEHDGVAHSRYFSADLVNRSALAWFRENPEPAPSELRWRRFSKRDAESLAAVGPEWRLARRVRDLTCLAPEPARGPLTELVDKAGARLWQYLSGRGEETARPVVVLVPGIMGSQLSFNGRLLWVSGWHLAQGQFSALHVAAAEDDAVKADDLLCLGYRATLEKLATEFNVVGFPYDWRRDVDAAARKLIDLLGTLVAQRTEDGAVGDVPIHIVAHSMGGLVVRRARQLDRDLFTRLGDGRVVLAGVPNHGSFATPLALIGRHAVIANLARLDLRASRDDWLDVLWTFPGLWQLLPQPGLATSVSRDGGDTDWLYDVATWQQRKVDHKRLEALLHGARDLHGALAEDHGQGLHLILGDGVRTPTGIRRALGPDVFEVLLGNAGDGTVALPCGELEEAAKTYYAPGVEHGNLVKDANVLQGILDILRQGTTAQLRDVPISATVRGGPTGLAREDVWRSPDEAERVLWPASGSTRGEESVAVSPDVWTRTEALDATLDALAPVLGTTGRSLPPLHVSMVHGGLEQAQYPLLIGHATGTPISGAEGRCDELMGGELSDLQLLGLYPDSGREFRYVPPADPWQRVLGVIVLGLNSAEPLTPTALAEQVSRAVLDFVNRTRQRKGTEEKLTRPLALSSVAVGTGPVFGLSIDRAAAAIVQGVLQGNEALHSSDLPLVGTIEFIERYGGKIEHAMASLQRLADSTSTVRSSRQQRIVLDLVVKEKDGARPGEPPPQYESGRWEHLSVEVVGPPDDDSTVRRLEYRFARDRAAASQEPRAVNRVSVERILRQAVDVPARAQDLGAVLYEQLLPYELKDELARSENLVLQVDGRTADIPWELLADRFMGGEKPLVCRAGLVRQFREGGVRARTVRAPKVALVVGNPPSDLPSLPRAREEARKVAGQLRGADFDVTHLEFDGAEDEFSGERVLEALFARDHQVVHIAAHGLYKVGGKQDDRQITGGVAIAKGVFLTADDFGNLRVPPDFVFLNCCHLGRLNVEDPRFLDAAGQSQAAGSLARALMRIGVKSVVVAGWQVGDAPAETFATLLYGELLGGVSYGDAVRNARSAVYEETAGRDNTWAAYQCYGDPGFRLSAGRDGTARGRSRLWIRGSAVRELEELAVQACEVEDHQPLAERLTALEQDFVEQWPHDGELLWLSGMAWSELGDFERAIDRYRTAISAETANPPVQTIEQLANMCSRQSIKILQQGGGDNSKIKALVDDATKRLDMLDHLPETRERLALKGGHNARRAVTDAPDLRDGLVETAIAHYARAAVATEPMLYPFRNAVQLAAVTGLRVPDALNTPEWMQRWKDEVNSGPEPGNFWGRIGCIESTLTVLLVMKSGLRDDLVGPVPTVEPDPLHGPLTPSLLSERYRSARQGGHRRRHWLSVVDHVWVLGALAPEGEVKNELQSLFDLLLKMDTWVYPSEGTEPARRGST
jgi:triacylglycerol esterase/lipase EstA (alpha/beta hydrolase family)/CHAT domain-containing protein